MTTPKTLDSKHPWHFKGEPEYLREQREEDELRRQEDREYDALGRRS